MLIPDEALAEIDSVASPNRTAFMVRASLDAARTLKRSLEDAEIEAISTTNARRARELAGDWDALASDGL